MNEGIGIVCEMTCRDFLSNRTDFHMNIVTEAVMDEALDRFFLMEEDEEIDRLIDLMGEQQPFLFTFLMTIGEGDFNENEREVLLFLGITLWQIASYPDQTPPQITEEALDSVEQSNLPLLEELAADQSSSFMQQLEKMAAEHPQAAMMEYVINAVVEETEEECFDQLEFED